MGSVIQLDKLPRVTGEGSLTRKAKGTDGKDTTVDFWREVTRLNETGLNTILKLAALDKEYDLTDFIRGIEYQGFNRAQYIKFACSVMSISLFCRFALLGSIRGSNFKRISETCEDLPSDMTAAFERLGFVKTPKKKNDLTILRCTASIPHWCAFHMLRANVTDSIIDGCHPALQFPGAASLPMSKEVRINHVKYCVAFSALIPGGQFKPSIYATAMSNTIPVADIPSEVLAILQVSSSSESYLLPPDVLNEYGSQVAVRK